MNFVVPSTSALRSLLPNSDGPLQIWNYCNLMFPWRQKSFIYNGKKIEPKFSILEFKKNVVPKSFILRLLTDKSWP